MESLSSRARILAEDFINTCEREGCVIVDREMAIQALTGEVEHLIAAAASTHEHDEPEQCACFRRGLEAIKTIRCVKHYAVPPFNASEIGGGECGACIAVSQQ